MEPVRIITGEWVPYISQAFERGGVVCHIVSEAFACVGLQVEYEFRMPWLEGVYEAAKTGSYAATMAWRPTPIREQDFIASKDPVMENRYVLFQLRSTSFDWRRFQDLRSHPIAGTRGFNYGDRFREAEARGLIDVRWTDTTLEAFNKLLSGEVALVAHDQGVGHDDLRRHLTPEQARRISFHPRMTDHHLSHVLFPRKTSERSRELCDAFDRGMAQLNASGEVRKWVEAFKAGRYRNPPYPGDYFTLENPLEALD